VGSAYGGAAAGELRATMLAFMAQLPASTRPLSGPSARPAARPGSPQATSLHADTARRGLLAAICAFLIWGLMPLYLRSLRLVAPLEIMAHRVLWGCLLVLAWLATRGELRAVARALTTQSTRRGLIVSALLVSCNWLAFVWAVSVGRVVDASLGYFINPLINVLFGVLFLSERLTPLRWWAVAAASLGVLWLGVAAGELPWIALVLALSFALYGLIRKLLQVDAVVGLAAETTLLLPLALAYLAWAHVQGTSTMAPGDRGAALLSCRRARPRAFVLSQSSSFGSSSGNSTEVKPNFEKSRIRIG
jgi:RarD protein